MKKKIILLILSLCLILSVVNISYAEDNKLSETAKEAYDVLSVLGFVANGYDEENISSINTVTRADFAENVYKVFYNNLTSDNLYFYDIPLSHYACKEISVLVEQGIVSVSQDKLFNPDKNVTKREAAKMLLYALGYAQLCEARGGWTVGIDMMAADMDLYKGIGMDDEFSYSDMLVMIYNAVMSEVLGISHIKGDDVVREGNGESYLSSAYDIYVNEGVLSGFDDISVFGDAVGENDVLIDNMILDSGNLDVTEYLGMRVKYLYKYTDDEGTLIWIKPTNKNKITQLNKFDNKPVFDESTYTFKYYNENDKQKTISLAKNVSVIYNNGFVKSGVKEVLNRNFYHIKLVSYDGDNEYDVAIIDDYCNYKLKALQDDVLYLEACDGTNEKSTINTADYERVEVYNSNGRQIEMDSFSNKMVLSIKKTVDKSRIVIYASDTEVKGNLKGTEVDDTGYPVFTIDDNEYLSFLDRNFDIVVGNNVSLLLDYNGYVADAEITSDTIQFGYLIKLACDEFDELLMFKIFNQEGKMTVYNAAKTLYIDGQKFKSKPMAAYNYMGGLNFYTTLVAFKTNSNGEITLIDTPENAEYAVRTDKNMLTKEMSTDGETPYENKGYKLGPKIRIGPDSVIFGIPDSPEKSEVSRFFVGGRSKLIYDTYYTATAYNYGTKDKEFNDIIVINRNFEMDKWGGNVRFLVDKVYRTVNDDGEVVYAIEGYQSSKKAEFKFTPEQSQKAETLKRGDILHLKDILGGAVADYTLVYSPSIGTKPTNTSYSIYGTRQLMFYVNDVIGTSIRAGFASGADFDEVVAPQNARIYVYDIENDYIEEGNINDMISYKVAGDKCSLVYYLSQSSATSMIVVYK